MYSYYQLEPVLGEGNTQEKEAMLITNQLKLFGAEFKATLLNKLFLAALRDTLSYSDKLIKAIFEPQRGQNLPTFIQQSNISVHPFVSFTDFTIADNVPVLRRILADHGTTTQKYKVPPTPGSYAPGFTPC